MICIEMQDCSLVIHGHAGYAKHGEDIICAAVSALGYTLISSLERVAPGQCEYTAKPGHMEVRCKPSPEARTAFDFVADGFLPMAQQNPKYIKFLKK